MANDQIASLYGGIWAEPIFSPYKPPPPPPAPKPAPKVASRRKNKAPPPPPVPSPALGQTQVAGVVSVQDVYELVTHNASTNDRKYLRVGDDLAGGKIVLVHPLGAVVRKNSTDYVYSLGSTLSAGKVLNEAEFPELYDALSKLARR